MRQRSVGRRPYDAVVVGVPEDRQPTPGNKPRLGLPTIRTASAAGSAESDSFGADYITC